MLAIGMTFVIATAGIDLSVGSMVAAAGVFGGILIADGGSSLVFMSARSRSRCCSGRSTRPRWPTAASSRSSRRSRCSRSPGGWRSCSTTSCRSACSTSTAARSATRARSRCCGSGPAGSPASRWSVFVFVAITIGGWVLLNRTRYGRYVVAVGGNREAARIAGVPVRKIVFSVYALSGLLAGIATVLLCARLGSASPVSGNLYELDAIGAVVIGGTSLAGGRATIVGTFLGVLTFALIFSLMTQLNLSTEVQQVTKGAIVLGAVLLQRPEARF